MKVLTEDEQEIVAQLAAKITVVIQNAARTNVRKSLVRIALALAAEMVSEITGWPE